MPKEKAPINIDPAMKDSDGNMIVGKEYSNGVQHFHKVDSEGRHREMSYDEVLEAYGYEPIKRDGSAEDDINHELREREKVLHRLIQENDEYLRRVRTFIEQKLQKFHEDDPEYQRVYSLERTIDIRDSQFITLMASKVAKEQFGLRLRASGDEGWEEDLETLDQLIEIFHMTNERYNTLLNTTPASPEPAPVDLADATPVPPVDLPDPVPTPADGRPSPSPDATLPPRVDEAAFWQMIDNAIERDNQRVERIQNIYRYLETHLLRMADHERANETTEFEQAERQFLTVMRELGKLEGWSEEQLNEKIDRFISGYLRIVGRDPAPVDPPDPLDDPAVAQRRELLSAQAEVITQELEHARARLARLTTKAHGRLWSSKKLKAELDEALADWERLHSAAGLKAMELALVDSDDATFDNLKDISKQFSQEEMSKLNDAQKLAAEVGPGGNWVKRFGHWYAKKYNQSGRLGKALWMFVPGAAVGITAGMAIGAVGGGLLAGLIARGAAKGVLGAKMEALKARQGSGVDFENMTFTQEDIDNMEAQAIARMVALRSSDRVKGDLKDSRKSNAKRAAKAVSIGAIVGAASGIAANMLLDQSPLRGGGVGQKVTGKKVPIIGENDPIRIRIPTNPLGPQGPSGGGIDPSLLEKIPPGTTQAHWDSMDRLFNSPGKWPFSRAENFFNGDGSQAMKWLEESVRRTPGAEWHGSGTGRWISVIDPETGQAVSDTDTVWRVLVNSALTPPAS